MICHPYVGTLYNLGPIYLGTKFYHFSFNRSGYMIGVRQNLFGTRDLLRPFHGWFVDSWASLC